MLRDSIHSLAHVGPAVLQNDVIFGLDFNFDVTFFDHAVADAAILYPAGQPGVFGPVKFIFDRQQRSFQTHTLAEGLSGGGLSAGVQNIVVAELPPVKPALGTQLVDTAFHGKGDLVDTESAHGPARDIVGVYGFGFNINIRNVIGTGRMAGGPFEHLGP